MAARKPNYTWLLMGAMVELVGLIIIVVLLLRSSDLVPQGLTLPSKPRMPVKRQRWKRQSA